MKRSAGTGPGGTILLIATTLLVATLTNAGVILDDDGDRVPDGFDNCTLDANGPDDAYQQTDSDDDGFGNSCDCDFTQDGLIAGDDLLLLFGQFNTATGASTEVFDMSGDGFVLADDILLCFGLFGGPPGPAGPL